MPLDNRPPPSSAIRQYSGVSRGRWEKDTLVVETTNFTRHGVATLSLRQYGGTMTTCTSSSASRAPARTRCVYDFTITDPATWTRPWSASIPMKKTDEGVFEYACHEGNRSLETFLENARAKDKAGESGAKKPR